MRWRERVDIALKVLEMGVSDLEHEAKDIVRKALRGENPEASDLLDQPVEALGLGTRAVGSLRANGIRSVEDLCEMTWTDLLEMRNLGRTTANEIVRALDRAGLRLGTNNGKDDETG